MISENKYVRLTNTENGKQTFFRVLNFSPNCNVECTHGGWDAFLCEEDKSLYFSKHKTKLLSTYDVATFYKTDDEYNAAYREAFGCEGD